MRFRVKVGSGAAVGEGVPLGHVCKATHRWVRFRVRNCTIRVMPGELCGGQRAKLRGLWELQHCSRRVHEEPEVGQAMWWRVALLQSTLIMTLTVPIHGCDQDPDHDPDHDPEHDTNHDPDRDSELRS